MSVPTVLGLRLPTLLSACFLLAFSGCSPYSQSSVTPGVTVSQYQAITIESAGEDKHKIAQELREQFEEMGLQIVGESSPYKHLIATWRYSENAMSRSKVWVDIFDSESGTQVYAGEGGSGTESTVGNDIRKAARLAVEDFGSELASGKRYPVDAAAPATASLSTGSGVLLCATGLIATNHHVVQGATSLQVAFADQLEAADAAVLREDPYNDIALLEAPALASTAYRPLHFVTSDKLQNGEHVTAIGFPLVTHLGVQPRITDGIVSSKFGMGSDPRWLQISVPIQSGNSGGPLFDDAGNLAGLIVASADASAILQQTGNIPQNINFAIKSDYLISALRSVPERHQSCLEHAGTEPLAGDARESVIESYLGRTVLILGVVPAN